MLCWAVHKPVANTFICCPTVLQTSLIFVVVRSSLLDSQSKRQFMHTRDRASERAMNSAQQKMLFIVYPIAWIAWRFSLFIVVVKTPCISVWNRSKALVNFMVSHQFTLKQWNDVVVRSETVQHNIIIPFPIVPCLWLCRWKLRKLEIHPNCTNCPSIMYGIRAAACEWNWKNRASSKWFHKSEGIWNLYQFLSWPAPMVISRQAYITYAPWVSDWLSTNVEAHLRYDIMPLETIRHGLTFKLPLEIHTSRK